MAQLPLFKPPRAPREKPKLNWFPKEQTEAAKLLLSNPSKYLPIQVQWAELYMARMKREQR